jgi:hypothetical protein
MLVVTRGKAAVSDASMMMIAHVAADGITTEAGR